MPRGNALLYLFAFLLCLAPAAAWGNPQGGTVVSGSASISASGNTLNIDQTSQRAVINWNSFNIASGETTSINTPSASSISVDRVTGGDPAQIYGTLKSNGEVILLDPNGIFFEKGSTVDANGIIASTGALGRSDQQEFMAGQGFSLTNIGANSLAQVINAGRITAAEGGLVALVAPSVANSGYINARLGAVTLAAGSTATVDLAGDGLISLAVNGALNQALVANSGRISAQGGTVTLSANAAKGVVDNVINMSGVIAANSYRTQGGKIILSGGAGGTVQVSGRLAARGTRAGQTGGSVNVTGEAVEIKSGAVIDASGADGGGTINIGGDLHGQGPLTNAVDTAIDLGALVKANALDSGNGGQIVVWSQQQTIVNGQIQAEGGAQAGNGGFVETSSHGVLSVSTSVDTGAPHGKAGEWLLDPASLTISDGSDANVVGNPSFAPDGTVAISNLTPATIEAALNVGTNVTITTGGDSYPNSGDIIVNSAVTATGGGSLTLSSYHDIIINAGITLQGGNLTLRADNTGLGSGYINVDAPISTSGGSIIVGGGQGVIAAGKGFAYGSAGVDGDMAQGDGVLVLSSVNAGGGSIVVNGEGVSFGNIAGNYNGVEVDNGPVTTTGMGSINITGVGGVGAVTHSMDYGVSLISGNAIEASGTGAVTINGVGGAGVAGANSGVYIGGSIVTDNNPIVVIGVGGGAGYTAAGQSTVSADGVDIYGTVQSTNGAISITSTGGQMISCSCTTTYGIFMDGGLVNSADGNVSLNGFGGINPGGPSAGIYIYADASVTSGGKGSVALNGTGMPRENMGYGIEILGGKISTVDGGLNITAQGSTAAGLYEIDHSLIETTGLGNISISGTGGGLVGQNAGIYIESGSVVQVTGAGSIFFDALGGSEGAGSYGADIEGSVEKISSGAGSITIIGYGGGNANTMGLNYGVLVSGSVQNVNGNILIEGNTGNGAQAITIAGGAGNHGVDISGIVQATGAGNISIEGVGGGAGAQNYGVFLDGGTLSTFNGNLNVAAYGGGNATGYATSNNCGFYATSGGVVETIGAGAISITGSGGGNGGGGSQNYGVYVTDSSAIQAVGGGSISITGTGGAIGGGSYTNGGVYVSTSSISANGGNIHINGQGETNSSTWGVGLDVENGGLVSTTAAGTIDIEGNGLHVQEGTISTENGNIVINAGVYPVWLGGYTLPAKGIISDVNGNIIITAEDVDVYGGLIGTVYQPPSIITTTGSGNIILNTNGVDLTTATSIDSAAGVTISPLTAGLPASIGPANGEFYLADTQLVDITWGTLLTIGGPTTGNMTIGTNFSFPKPVLFQNGAGADITLTRMLTSTNASGTSITLASGQDFINDVGASAINPGGGRWLSYSTNPDDDTINGLVTDFVRYSCSFGGACPFFPSVGNGFLYRYMPLLTVTPNALNTWVGDSALPSLSGYTYTLSGYRGNDGGMDKVTGSLNGATNYTPGKGIGAYNINYVDGSLSSSLGYGFVYANNVGGLAVIPYVVAVTANAQSKVYGSTDPVLTYTYTVEVSNDQSPVLTGSLTRVAGENVGTYAINQGTLNAGPDYAISYAGNNLTITPYALTVAANAQSKVYGSVDPVLTYASGSLQNRDTASIFSGSLSRVVGENVGAYAISQGSLSAGPNYTISYTGNNLTIAPYTLAVTGNAQSKVYGSADPALTYTYGALQNGDTAGVFTGGLARASGESVGAYAIGRGSLNAGENYTISYTGNNLAITPYTLKVAANAETKIYGSADPVFAYSYGALQNGDTAAVFTGTLGRVAGENVGAYGINQGSLGAGQNYVLSFTGNSLVITPAPLTITANISMVYGGAAPALTPSYIGLVNGDTAASLAKQAVVVSGTSFKSNAGTYKNTLTASGAVDPNYTISYTPGTLTIVPYTLDIAANAESKIYGTVADPALTWALTGGTSLQNGDRATVITGALTRVAGQNAGTYAINQGSLSAGPNYTISYTGNTLTILPYTLAVSAAAKAKVYGAADPLLTYTYGKLQNGDTAAVFTGSLARVVGQNAGAYAITEGSLSAGPNYAISYTGANLTISPYKLAVTANAQGKVYGSADPLLAYTYGALQNGDTAAVFTGALARVAGQNVGTYAISQGSLSAGANYALSFTGSKLTITPYTLAVAANAQTKVYGSADPALTYTHGALQNGDTAAVFTGALARVAGQNVGSYVINQGTLSAGKNYTISYTGNTLTITPYTLTVTANAVSKAYGAVDPVLTYSYGALQEGDTARYVFGGSLARTAGQNVGTYAINQGTLTAGKNYIINFVGNNLTILPYALSVKANAATKVYGSADPALTYTYGKLQNGDTASIITGSLTRVAGETVGAYAINQGTLSLASPNYTLVFTGANLTITPYRLTVVANPETIAYRSPDPVLTYTYGTLQNGDTAAVFTGSLTRVAGEAISRYAIRQGTLSAGANYTIVYTGNYLTIKNLGCY